MKAYSSAPAVSHVTRRFRVSTTVPVIACLIAIAITIACKGGNHTDSSTPSSPLHIMEEDGVKDSTGVKVVFTGDVMLDRGVAKIAQRHGYEHLWHPVDSLFHTADAVVINLECPVTERWQPVNKLYVFRASPASLPAMRKAGITHATLANNHSMDHGHAGLSDTDSLLRRHGITPLGLGHSPNPVFIVPGVAVISAMQMPVENWIFTGQYADVCCASTDSLIASVRLFKHSHPNDRLVLCLHWGAEYQPQCTTRQRLDAHRLIDAGADAIVGHHPHVVQNAETYRGRPIYYSLGNLIFDNPRPETRTTCLLQLTFQPDTIEAAAHLFTFSQGMTTLRSH